ncbi:MAG: dephospho-CoA kinase [Caldilineaceae bacterium]
MWVVTSHPDVQLRRLVDQRGMDEEAARQRMAAQSHQAQKIAQADYVIVNDGSLEDLYAQLDDLWDGLLNRARSKRAAWI